MSQPNPVHHDSCDPHVAWTTGNLAEAMPGVSTPLNWSLFGQYDDALYSAFAEMGVYSRGEISAPRRLEERFVGIFYGRSAANLEMMRALADRLPGVSPDAVEEQLMGSVRPGLTTNPVRRRYPVVLTKMPLVIARLPKRVRRTRRETQKWWLDVVRRAPDLDTAGARDVLREAVDRFRRVIVPHCLVSFLATPKYEQVCSIADACGSRELAGRLLGATGEVEEADLVSDLWEVSQGHLSLDEYISRHGYHGPEEGQITSLSWREDRSSLDRTLGSYKALPESATPPARRRERVRQRAAAWQDCVGAARPLTRWRRRQVITSAARYLGLREQGKASYLMVLDGARIAARILGRGLAAENVIDVPDDVFFLTADEALGQDAAVRKEVIAERRKAHADYLRHTVAPSWEGMPTPIPVAANTEAVEPDRAVTGLGVSPGTYEGIARVCLDPHDSDIEPGEVLVCATTDPSYALAFSLAGAAVIDTGGPLSHGAIVARELGVPCVINTINGTRSIRDGDRLLVNGSTGTVQILSES